MLVSQKHDTTTTDRQESFEIRKILKLRIKCVDQGEQKGRVGRAKRQGGDVAALGEALNE